MLLGVAGLFVVGHPEAWAAGVVFGTAAGAFVALRDSPPEYVDKWRRGAEGERKTARALRRLGSSRWTIVHDVDAGYGNYDHIVVGPAGVFLLDSKHLQGTVHLANGRPHLRRRLDPDDDRPLTDCASAAERLARHLHDELKRRTGESAWVHAVVVLWSDSNQDLYKLGKCTLVRGDSLRRWLLQQDAKLDQAGVARLSAAVEALAASAQNDGPVVTPSSGFEPDHPTRSIGQQAAVAAQTQPNPAVSGLISRAAPIRKALQIGPKPRPGGHLRHCCRAAS